MTAREAVTYNRKHSVPKSRGSRASPAYVLGATRLAVDASGASVSAGSIRWKSLRDRLIDVHTQTRELVTG